MSLTEVYPLDSRSRSLSTSISKSFTFNFTLILIRNTSNLQRNDKMALAGISKLGVSPKEEYETISNRISVALAKHENLVKSWTSTSVHSEPVKSQAELDAEDAVLFRNQPLYLGVGAPIPAQFLTNDTERTNKSLRAKFFNKGLNASKSRDADEKAESAKRTLTVESSDEEEGRSGLGKAKKLKTSTHISRPIEAEDDVEEQPKVRQLGNVSQFKKILHPLSQVIQSLATPPITPPKNTVDTNTKEAGEHRRTTNQTEVQEQKEEQEIQRNKRGNEAKRRKISERKAEKRRAKRMQLKMENEKARIAASNATSVLLE